MSNSFRPFSSAALRLRRRLDEPLLVALLAAILGILLADRGIYHPLSALSAIALGTWFGLLSGKRSFLLLALAGAFALAHDCRQSATLALPFAGQIQSGEKLFVEAEGIVDSVPKQSTSSSPGRVSFFLTLTKIRQLGGAALPARQRLYVSGNADPPPRYGDRLELTGSLRPPGSPNNPGEFDFGQYLKRKGVIAQLSPSPGNGIRIVDSGHGNPIIVAANRARRWVEAAITRDLAHRDPEAAGVLTAMTLGSRSDAREEIIDSFRTSGTLHIFAVSGLHVGLIGIILWQLLTPLPINRRVRALVIIAVLCGYAFITGLRPSAVRATIMASLILAGPLLDREPRVINSLGAAGLAILAYDTNQLFLPGFQLSFTVLLSLTLLHRPIMALFSPLVSPDPFLPQSLLSEAQRLYYKVARGVAETLSVSIAAWLGSLPLMVYHFHLVTPIAPIANLLLIPIAFCILGTAILSTIASASGLVTLGSVLNNANFLWATALTGAAGFFANLPVPLSHFYTGTPSILRPPCEITVLDLPRGGACTLISTRRGEDWLIDTGSARDFRPTVAAVLHQHAGVTHLDGAILTHADAAHIGGTSEVIGSFRPDIIRPPLKNNSSSSYRSLAARLDAGHQKTITPGRDEAIGIGDDCTITTLYQPDGDRHPRLSDDACSVFLLESRGWRILFTGDAGFDTEQILLATERENLRADLMIRGSHNSDYSSTPDFLAAVQPVATIVNARHFEDDDTGEKAWRDAMDQAGIVLFDQGLNGAISIRIDAGQLSISSFKSDQSLTLKRAR